MYLTLEQTGKQNAALLEQIYVKQCSDVLTSIF